MFVQYESRFGAVEITTGHLLSKNEKKKERKSGQFIFNFSNFKPNDVIGANNTFCAIDVVYFGSSRHFMSRSKT
jgi:hypothetical protein